MKSVEEGNALEEEVSFICSRTSESESESTDQDALIGFRPARKSSDGRENGNSHYLHC